MSSCRAFLFAACFLALAAADGQAQPDPLAAKKATWQKTLDEAKFRFTDSEANMLFSLSQYLGDCKLHMIFDPKQRFKITYKFVRDDKEILSIDGHQGSVFRTW